MAQLIDVHGHLGIVDEKMPPMCLIRGCWRLLPDRNSGLITKKYFSTPSPRTIRPEKKEERNEAKREREREMLPVKQKKGQHASTVHSVIELKFCTMEKGWTARRYRRLSSFLHRNSLPHHLQSMEALVWEIHHFPRPYRDD